MHRGTHPFKVTGSAAIGTGAAGTPIRVFGWAFTETGGSTALVIKFVVPTVTQGAGIIGPNDGTGTEMFRRGIAISGQEMIDQPTGILFQNGLYIVVTGGTLLGSLFID